MKVLILAVLALMGCSEAKRGTTASIQEAKDYIKSLKMSGVEMTAAESFGGQQLIEIIGNIQNQGNRPLLRVDLTCVFRDPYGQVVLRETVPIVRADRGGLKPGETKPFRLPFDQVPKTWDQAMPNLVMAGVVFE